MTVNAGKPWAYLERMFETVGIEPLDRSKGKESGAVGAKELHERTGAEGIGSVYLALSGFLERAVSSDALFYDAVEACKARGFDDKAAKDVSYLFFAANQFVDPMGSGDLDAGAVIPIGELCEDVNGYLRDTEATDARLGVRERLLLYILKIFVDHKQELEAEKAKLSQLIPSDKVFFPTSKVFNKQREIAEYGAGGVPVDVGGGAKVWVSISGQNGEKIDLTAAQAGIQSAVGQLVMVNGTPLRVTPAQIYREYAGMKPGETVNEAEIEFTINVMDSLMFGTSGTLDATAQFQKHKGLNGEEAVCEEFKRHRASLIVGVKDTSGTISYGSVTSVNVVYTIYKAPLLWEYSRAIKQIACVDRDVLSGGSASSKLPAGHPDKAPLRKTPKVVAVRRCLMGQIERMKADRKKQKKKGEKPAGAFAENLTFETIACLCDIKQTHNLAQQLRIDVRKILQDFKAEKYIAGFEEYKEGRRIKGVRIIL